MTRSTTLFFALAMALPSTANALPDGRYSVGTEGASGFLTISGNSGSIDVRGQNCGGRGHGDVFRAADGSWLLVLTHESAGDASCVLQGTPLINGVSSFMEGPGCQAFHETGCNLTGTASIGFSELDMERDDELVVGGQAVPPAPIPLSDTTQVAAPGELPDLRPNAAVMRSAFNARGGLEREAIQRELAFHGYYTSSIDGLYGSGTERALLSMAQSYLSAGLTVDLGSEGGVQAFLDIVGMPTSFSMQAAGVSMAYEGTWSCGFGRFTLAGDRYQITSEDGSRIFGEGSFTANGEGPLDDFVGLTLEGRGNLSLFSITANTMGAHDPLDGSTLMCERES